MSRQDEDDQKTGIFDSRKGDCKVNIIRKISER